MKLKTTITTIFGLVSILNAQDAKVEVFEIQPSTNQIKIGWELTGLDMGIPVHNTSISTTALFGAGGVPKLDHESGKYIIFRLSARQRTGRDRSWKILDEQTLSTWLPTTALQIHTKEGSHTYKNIDEGNPVPIIATRTRADWTYNWGIRAKGGINWGKPEGTPLDPQRDFAWIRRTWQEKDPNSGLNIGPLVETLAPIKIALGTGKKPSYGPDFSNKENPHMQLTLPGPEAPVPFDPEFLKKRRGTETIEVYVPPVLPELPTGLKLTSHSIEVFPQTSSTVTIGGPNADKLEKEPDGTPIIRSQFPIILFNNLNVYPRHLVYARVYKGKPGTGTNPYIFPTSLKLSENKDFNSSIITYAIPEDEIRNVVKDKNYNQGEKDGYWTIEYIHAIPTQEGIDNNDPTAIVPDTTEIIGTYEFKLESNIKANAIINESN